MSSIGSPGGDFPLLAETLEIKEGKGRVNLSAHDGRVIQVAAENINANTSIGEDWDAREMKQAVDLQVNDKDSGALLQISVKVNDLARSLGVMENEILWAQAQGKLEEFIGDQLMQAKVNDAAQSRSMASQNNEIPSQVELDPAVKKELLEHLDQFGLTHEEFAQIESFYNEHYQELAALTSPTHFRKEAQNPPLPRSVVYIPDGPRKGLFVLLKSKRGMKEIGLGSENRATKALHFDTGAIKVFRDGRAGAVRKGELDANQKAEGRPDLFAAGTPVSYTGPWRSRNRQKNIEKDKRPPREENIKKIGFIMDLIEKGELADRTFEPGKIDYIEAVRIGLQIAKGVQCMHEKFGMAHLDLKPENIFMTKDDTPKISDFGFAENLEETISDYSGTPGFMAPEIVDAMLDKVEYEVSEKSDIWSLGCILAELAHGPNWYHWNGQSVEDWEKALNTNAVEKAKGLLFPYRTNPEHLDSLIDACLRVDSVRRPTAKQVVEKLEKIYQILNA